MKAKLAGILFFCLANCLTCISQPGVTFPLSGQAFFYHPLSKALLLAGGAAAIPDSINSDIWKWDGRNWTKIAAKGPGSRSFFMGALDTKTGKLNFYGGMDFTEIPKGDMWTFDGETWASVKINSIGTHDHHNMVYMDHLNAFLVYGGNINGYPNFDSTTWVFKNGKFSGLKIPGPGPRWHYGMVYDKYRKKVMLYGGGENPGEQWEFDGTKWTKIITTVNPGKRFYHEMIYNEDTKTIILHGGWHNQDPRDSTNFTPRSTWEWNGLSWKKIAEEPIFARAMAYYPERKSIIAFGTTGKYNKSNIAIWELKNNKWSKLADYGKWTTLDILKKHMEQNPNDMQVLAKYAGILQWETRQYPEAEEAYKKFEAAYPNNSNYWPDLAFILAAQDKFNEANKYIIKLKEIGVFEKDIYTRLAGLLYQDKKYNEAIIYFNKLIEIDPTGQNFYNQACTYAIIGKKDLAFEGLQKAIDNGYNSKTQFESEVALDALKADERWKILKLK